MGSHRFYEIKSVMTGNPPTPRLALIDDGKVIEPDEKLRFDKKDDGLKRHELYRIRFEIDNFENSNLRFVPNIKDVMWVQPGSDISKCPKDPCSMPDVFWTDRIHPQGKWIEVLNKDRVREEFWFTLNFCDKSNANPTLNDYIPLDPGGDNQNGGEPLISYVAVTGIACGVVGFLTNYLTTGHDFVASTGAAYALGGLFVGLLVGYITDRMSLGL